MARQRDERIGRRPFLAPAMNAEVVEAVAKAVTEAIAKPKKPLMPRSLSRIDEYGWMTAIDEVVNDRPLVNAEGLPYLVADEPIKAKHEWFLSIHGMQMDRTPEQWYRYGYKTQDHINRYCGVNHVTLWGANEKRRADLAAAFGSVPLQDSTRVTVRNSETFYPRRSVVQQVFPARKVFAVLKLLWTEDAEFLAACKRHVVGYTGYYVEKYSNGAWTTDGGKIFT